MIFRDNTYIVWKPDYVENDGFVRVVSSRYFRASIHFISMAIHIGINGFGRIGRNAARIVLSTNNMILTAINSLSDASSHAYLLTHDSIYGPPRETISVKDTQLFAGKQHIHTFAYATASDIPWDTAQVDVVLECTGKFRTEKEAEGHMTHGVRGVVISAPAKDATPTFVRGVNDDTYGNERIISSSSCTTNCLATVLKVLDGQLGVVRGTMTTVHSVTDSQNLLDNSHKKDIRLRRSAMMNIIPTSTGSANDIAKLFPHLKGKLACRSLRVPTPTVSLIELVVQVKKTTDVHNVNSLFTKASQTYLNHILAVSDEPLVSSDFRGNPHSSIVDMQLTDVVEGTLVHVTAWYDNEWGYTNRLVELARLFTKRT